MFFEWGKIAVLGASGKMGSGISSLILQKMAYQKAANPSKQIQLILIDIDQNNLNQLKKQLKKQLIQFAEKQIIYLRKCVEQNLHLVSNEEVISNFLENSMEIVEITEDYHSLKDCQFVFEAITEDIELKVNTLKHLSEFVSLETLFLTNTSSIPIALLSKQVGLDQNRILGFHFYNPPLKQKLVEVIALTAKSKDMGEKLALELNKTAVFAKDVAGFIGNGHFIREVHFACELAREVSKERARESAISLINQVTQTLLLRPMGIFQLVDYVGIDVCHHIMKIMQKYLPEPTLEEPLLLELLQKGVKGGQHLDGSQKDGFFKYADGKPSQIYTSNGYKDLSEHLLIVPFNYTWKQLTSIDASQRQQMLQDYFQQLEKQETFEAELALRFLFKSAFFAELLVDTQVAASKEDVKKVLMLGFYHLYSPFDVVKEVPYG